MSHSRIYLTIILLLLVGLACAVPSLPMDENAFNTSVAQTVIVGLTQNYVSPTFTLTPTVTLTPTLILPTATLTSTGTVTPTFPFVPTVPSSTHVGLPPQVIVSVNTNCRAGPGKMFDVEGSLISGESAEVFGIDPTGEYWYIRNPDPGTRYCWVSGKYANFIGAASFVPVLTPIPTPTSTATPTPVPNFRVAFNHLDSCGNWWADLNFYNTGEMPFKSVMIKAKDTFSAREHTSVSDGFIDMDGCSSSTTIDVLKPGEIVTVSAPEFPFNLGDRKLIITATVCSETGMTGFCLTKTIWFKP